jgi:hypothetical protein
LANFYPFSLISAAFWVIFGRQNSQGWVFVSNPEDPEDKILACMGDARFFIQEKYFFGARIVGTES